MNGLFQSVQNAIKAQIEYAKRNPGHFPFYGQVWGFYDTYSLPLKKWVNKGLPAEGDIDEGTISIDAAVSAILFSPKEAMTCLRKLYSEFKKEGHIHRSRLGNQREYTIARSLHLFLRLVFSSGKCVVNRKLPFRINLESCKINTRIQVDIQIGWLKKKRIILKKIFSMKTICTEKSDFILAITLLFVSQFIMPFNSNAVVNEIPYLKTENNITRLMVDGKPFLMLAGELHNSTSSAPEYFAEAINNAVTMNVNTVIASVAWEQFEPQEGQYDYKYIDFILKNAREHNLKVVLIWFASWKNGESSYVPLWVKKDTNRFFRIKNKQGDLMSAISPFCEQAKVADGNAFVELMKYIKAKDTEKTIVMMQPENEVGAFSEMDYNKKSLQLYASPVPEQLIQYLKKNKNTLEKELKTAWEANGYKTNGTWAEVFGESNFDAQNFFMSWQYATYINEISRRGKEIYNLPMYVNAWLVQFPTEQPGKYPNGGPVSRVMDIYKAGSAFH